jgi:two-component system nitrate/nitrite response regulator NarL
MKDAAAPIRVALVDDHRTVLRGLEWLINTEPAMRVCGTATNLEDAKRLCAEHRPDVLVLDLDLGTHSGVDAIPELARDAAVLILTGMRDPAVHQAAVAAGARGVVPKEAEPDTILKAIRKVHAGEIWLDRVGIRKVFSALATGNGATLLHHDPAVASLTPREREIIRVLSANAGAPAKQIASMLDISEHTLRNHLSSIYSKLGLGSRLALYEFSQKHRIR